LVIIFICVSGSLFYLFSKRSNRRREAKDVEAYGNTSTSGSDLNMLNGIKRNDVSEYLSYEGFTESNPNECFLCKRSIADLDDMLAHLKVWEKLKSEYGLKCALCDN